jgi:hypothetical protein
MAGVNCARADTLAIQRHSFIVQYADKGHISQLNYHAVGKNLPLHRAAVQRLTTDLLARLGTFIADGAELKVWPSPATDHFCWLRIAGAQLLLGIACSYCA